MQAGRTERLLVTKNVLWVLSTTPSTKSKQQNHVQISLEVDVKKHKEMPIHSNCLVSETVRSLPDDYAMRSIKHYLKEPPLLHQQHDNICANKDYSVG